MASSHPNPTGDHHVCLNSRFISHFPRCRIAPINTSISYCEHCIQVSRSQHPSDPGNRSLTRPHQDGFGRNEDRDAMLFLRAVYYRRQTGNRESETRVFGHVSSTETGAASSTHADSTPQPLVLNNCQITNLFNHANRNSRPPIHPPPSALLPPDQHLSHMHQTHHNLPPPSYLGLWPLTSRPATTTLHDWQDPACPIHGDPTPRPSPVSTPPLPSPLGTPPPQGERARPIWRCPDNVPTPVYPDPPRRPENPYCPEEQAEAWRCPDNVPTPVYPSPPRRPTKPYCPEEKEEEEEEEAGCTSSSDDSEPDSSDGEGDLKGDLKGDPKGKSRRNLWERGIRGVRRGLRRPDWVGGGGGGGGAKLSAVADGPAQGDELPRRGSELSLEMEGEGNEGAKAPTVAGVPVRGGFAASAGEWA